MQDKKIFASLIHLSMHMWEDETSTPRPYYPPAYSEENLCDLKIWDETMEFLASRKYNLVLIDVGDAIKYESHPEIAAPDAWDKDFLRQKLREIRALGMEPIPKLNFSACHDTWLKEYRRMISTPTYYRVCADVIKEVCEVFDYPRFFHLGLDEEGVELQKNFEMITVRNASLWWHDLYFLFAECEKHGARPWVWSDYAWHHRDLFLKNMPKSVLQSNWYYGKFLQFPPEAREKIRIDTYTLLDKEGFDQIPTCSTWATAVNPRQTAGFCKESLSDEHLFGIMTAAWCRTNAEERYAIWNDAERLYYARKAYFPETL